MKLLTTRQVQRLKGREYIAFHSGVAYTKGVIKNLPFFKKLKILFTKR